MIDYASKSDTELQQLAKNGDREAEDVLAERYSRMVRACARPLFLAGGDSSDLIQEGMFGLLSAIRQYDPEAGTAFRSYAEHCVRMRLLSAVKSASRMKHLPLNDSMPLEQLSEDPSMQLSVIPGMFWHNPEDLVLARESEKELYSVFSRCLSKMENQVLVLYLQGLSYKEIALEIDKDEKSVDNAVQRIRRKLARNLKHGECSES